MSAAVHVTKEAVEHVLLNAGLAQTGENIGSAHWSSPPLPRGWHHQVGRFMLLALFSIVGTAIACDNHSVLTNGNFYYSCLHHYWH